MLEWRMPGLDGIELASMIRSNTALAGSVIMMLTSDNRSGDVAHCRSLGIDSYLVKPVRRSELLSSILRALADVVQPAPAGGEDHETAPAAKVRRQILIAEDNPVNQRFVCRTLETLGHFPTTA